MLLQRAEVVPFMNWIASYKLLANSERLERNAVKFRMEGTGDSKSQKLTLRSLKKGAFWNLKIFVVFVFF